MICLTKGQGINLTKSNSSLNKINIALGWEEANADKGLFSLFHKQDIDCDASLACLNSKGKLIGNDYVVYYGNKNIDGIHHSGDDLVGGGNKDNETISIVFKDVSPKVARIPVFMNIYNAADRHQNLSSLKKAYIRVYNAETNEELCRYDLDSDMGQAEGFIAGELSKENDDWKFTAIGECVKKASRISDIISRW